jgi:hypothetical protein
MKTQTLTRDYHAQILVNTSAKEAFKHIANVPAWWAKHFEGSARRLHDVFTVRFGETFVRFSISESVPDQKIVWKVEDCHLHWLKDKKEWNGTEIVWKVSSRDGSTAIDMTHVGLNPDVECFENCQQGWNHYIKVSLFKLITEGHGLLDPPKKS